MFRREQQEYRDTLWRSLRASEERVNQIKRGKSLQALVEEKKARPERQLTRRAATARSHLNTASSWRNINTESTMDRRAAATTGNWRPGQNSAAQNAQNAYDDDQDKLLQEVAASKEKVLPDWRKGREAYLATMAELQVRGSTRARQKTVDVTSEQPNLRVQNTVLDNRVMLEEDLESVFKRCGVRVWSDERARSLEDNRAVWNHQLEKQFRMTAASSGSASLRDSQALKDMQAVERPQMIVTLDPSHRSMVWRQKFRVLDRRVEAEVAEELAAADALGGTTTLTLGSSSPKLGASGLSTTGGLRSTMRSRPVTSSVLLDR